MKDKTKAIIVDFDGTLYDSSGRKHYVEGKEKNFEKFYEEAIYDEPNEWCAEIVRRFSSEYAILYVSGRPEKYKDDAVKWLEKHSLPIPYPYTLSYDLICMRRDGDYRKDCVIEKEIYDKFIEPNYDVVFCLDDRKQVVDMWRSLGLTCLQCEEGNF